jgi:Patched family
VLFARISVGDFTFSQSCDDLKQSWTSVRASVEEKLVACVQDLKLSYVIGDPLPGSCPLGFSPTLVDELYGESNMASRYSSSLFSSSTNGAMLYKFAGHYDKARRSKFVEGAYDTALEDFNNLLIDESLISDMILASASAFVTMVAILVHTRSPFLTVIGILQIALSFPVAYFFYRLVLGLEFFPFLNFIAVFVVFSVGSDDTFVAVDKWKNARLDYPTASIQQIAAIALPDAASAMFTTSVSLTRKHLLRCFGCNFGSDLTACRISDRRLLPRLLSLELQCVL